MSSEPETAARSGRAGLLRGLPWIFFGTSGYMLSLAALTFVLPRFLSPYEFGEWQLFQFYVLYLGYITFGYSDGLLLRLAGKPWGSLPHGQVGPGLLFLAVAEVASFLLLSAVLWFVLTESDWRWFAAACIGVAFYVPRVTITFLFQATGRAQTVMISMLVERAVLLGAAVAFCLHPGLGLPVLALGDIVGKAIGLTWSLFKARDVISLSTFDEVRRAWPAFLGDCRSGMFVVLSNLSALALNGAVRLTIATTLGTVAFGQVSLALQFSTIFLVVVNAVSVALFPNLKAAHESQWPAHFYAMSRVTLPLAMVSLCLALPIGWLLDCWMPGFERAVTLLILLMPVGYFEIKSRGILSVFMKAVRAEKALFVANVISAVVGALACYIAARYLESLTVAACTLVGALWLRSLVVERMLHKRLGVGPLPTLLEAACLGAYYIMATVSTAAGFAGLCVLSALFRRRLIAPADYRA